VVPSRRGSGEPLILLHGVMGTPLMRVAKSVCALSPAGMWIETQHSDRRCQLHATTISMRWTRGLLPGSARSALFRRQRLRGNAVHNERVAAELLHCAAAGSARTAPLIHDVGHVPMLGASTRGKCHSRDRCYGERALTNR